MRRKLSKLTAVTLTLVFALGVASPAFARVGDSESYIDKPGTASSTWYKGETIPVEVGTDEFVWSDDYNTFKLYLCPKGKTKANAVWTSQNDPEPGYVGGGPDFATVISSTKTRALTPGVYRLDLEHYYLLDTGSQEYEGDPLDSATKYTRYVALNIKQLLAPTGLKAAPTTKSIPLTWTKAAGATSYEIWRSVGNNTSFVKYKTVTANSFTDTSVKQGVWYYYKLFSVRNAKSAPDADGNVDYYGKVTSPRTPVLKTALKLTAPGKPTGVKATAGTRQVTVTWTKASLATKYQVWRSTKKSSSFKQIATVTGTKYVNKSLKKGSRYYYRVKAVRVTKTGTKVGAVSAPALSGKVR